MIHAEGERAADEQLAPEELRHEIRQILPGLLTRVEYKEGDTFLVRVSGTLSDAARARFNDGWKEHFPGAKCLILEEDMEVQLVGKA